MAKSKKVQMPIGIRNKLMAAVSMLLVSSIMMVSSTFAWFTLSTAPEVTGITTSVGANGNLEMALLTTDTYGALDTIQSAVGNSSAATHDVTQSNITWGNLVDLSAASYGLNNISLLPADVNGTVTDGKLASVTTASLLKTPTYGADGRVNTVEANTVSAIYNPTNANFPYAAGSQTYGVRAIGVTTTMSARQMAFGSAKANANSALTTAKAGTKAALSTNMSALIAFANANGAPSSYTEQQIAAFKAVAAGVVSDIAALESGYRNALIALAAANASDDATFAASKTAIETADLVTLANQANTANQTDMATAIGSLKTAQDNAKSAQTTLGTATVGTPAQTVTDAIKLLIGATPTVDDSDTPIKVYITTGAVGELAKQLGKFELANVTGVGVAYAGNDSTGTGTYTAAVGVVNGLTPTWGASSANISDTYGYVIDFAFRTNASGADLQLQTKAANRVYSDQTATDLATQGSGSNVTFTYTNGLSAKQAETLLSNIKLVFFNPNNGTVYATAGLTDITDNAGTSATANVKMESQTGDVGKILTLGQNTATRVSVLVYLDGNQVQNKDVANAATSGSLKLNLQFSSSVPLIPMENTALKSMIKTATATITGDSNITGGTGNLTVALSDGFTIDSVEWTSDNSDVTVNGSGATATVNSSTDASATITAKVTYRTSGGTTLTAENTFVVTFATAPAP